MFTLDICFLLTTFYDFLTSHFKKSKNIFWKSEKTHKIRILEHWHGFRGQTLNTTAANEYQLSRMDPRDGIVLQAEVDDRCDKLAVDRRRYCQLRRPPTV